MGSLGRTQLKGFLVGLLAVPLYLSAEPMIEVDSADFDLGTIREGEMKVAKHTFKVKNTGDVVLVIQQVKPG